jgi:hypothetical protein
MEIKLGMNLSLDRIQASIRESKMSCPFRTSHAQLCGTHQWKWSRLGGWWRNIYKEESVNRSQMDIKHVIFEPGKKTFISRHILQQHWYTCPIALPVHVNLQHRSYWLLSQPLLHLRFNLFVISETFATKAESLYATNTSYRKQETFLHEYPFHWVFLPIKTHNKTLLFGSKNLKYCRHFDYWNQPLNMRMRVC